MEIQHFTFLTPLGNVRISGTADAIKSISFIDNDAELTAVTNKVFPVLTEAKKQLNEYFLKERKAFTIPLAPDGTDFQKKVWKVLQEIPFGATITYGKLAFKLGDKNLMRAVGGANGKNPISIIIPCHRVIGTGGILTGYSGGVWKKKWLLDLENLEKQEMLF